MTNTHLANRCTQAEAEAHWATLEAAFGPKPNMRNEWIRRFQTMHSTHLAEVVEGYARGNSWITWQSVYNAYSVRLGRS